MCLPSKEDVVGRRTARSMGGTSLEGRETRRNGAILRRSEHGARNRRRIVAARPAARWRIARPARCVVRATTDQAIEAPRSTLVALDAADVDWQPPTAG